MIFTFEYSAVGSSHLMKGEGNQDAKKITVANNGWTVAAVADGVGSCKYSDIASTIAVNTSVRVCIEEINKNGEKHNLLHVIEKAFAQAEREIDERSLAKNHFLSDYDTTLSLVVYNGTKVTYGHSGDGGIIGLTSDGDYVKITTPQKKEGVYVVPLRAGKDAWIINHAEGEFASVLLATDGVYDTFFPYLLKGQPIEVYIRLARYFMDNNILNFSDETKTSIIKEREDYLDSDSFASITDDKTIVVLLNGEVYPTIKDDSYYSEPDWAAFQLEWNKKAYPHLYDGNDTASSEAEKEAPENETEVASEDSDNHLSKDSAPIDKPSKKEEKPLKKKWWGGRG